MSEDKETVREGFLEEAWPVIIKRERLPSESVLGAMQRVELSWGALGDSGGQCRRLTYGPTNMYVQVLLPGTCDGDLLGKRVFAGIISERSGNEESVLDYLAGP